MILTTFQTKYIEWELDVEDGLDGYDPLGKIVFLGDEGKIEDDCTYLDSFFEALSQGFPKIEVGKTIAIDPIVEPNDVVCECSSDRLKIIYGSQIAIVFNLVDFLNNFREALERFIETIDTLTHQAGQEKRRLFQIREYLDRI